MFKRERDGISENSSSKDLKYEMVKVKYFTLAKISQPDEEHSLTRSWEEFYPSHRVYDETKARMKHIHADYTGERRMKSEAEHMAKIKELVAHWDASREMVSELNSAMEDILRHYHETLHTKVHPGIKVADILINDNDHFVKKMFIEGEKEGDFVSRIMNLYDV